MDLLQSNWVATCEKARVTARSLRKSQARCPHAGRDRRPARLPTYRRSGGARRRSALPRAGGRHDPAVRPDAGARAAAGRARQYRRRSPPASVAAVRAGGRRRGAASRIAQRRRAAPHGRRGADDPNHAGGDRARVRGAGALAARRCACCRETRERRAAMTNFVDLWVYLSGSPLLWLTTTLLAYLAADAIPAACGRHPLANPVLIAVTFVSIVVVASGTSFPAYFAGAQFVHFLLGPATVALAVPLVRHLPQVRRALVSMLMALVA